MVVVRPASTQGHGLASGSPIPEHTAQSKTCQEVPPQLGHLRGTVAAANGALSVFQSSMLNIRGSAEYRLGICFEFELLNSGRLSACLGAGLRMT